MIFETLVVGGYQVNCFIISGDDTNCIIIDPGFEADRIRAVIERRGLVPQAIVNTHGHGDHIGTNAEWGLPIWIHEGDSPLLQDPELNISALVGTPVTSPPAARFLRDNEVCEVCGLTFTVLHTPGHTPGCVCFDFGDFVIVGDTLFQGSVGRTDFPYSDSRAIVTSIKEKLMCLDDQVIAYPGHGPSTSIGYERKNNFFLR